MVVMWYSSCLREHKAISTWSFKLSPESLPLPLFILRPNEMPLLFSVFSQHLAVWLCLPSNELSEKRGCAFFIWLCTGYSPPLGTNQSQCCCLTYFSVTSRWQFLQANTFAQISYIGSWAKGWCLDLSAYLPRRFRSCQPSIDPTFCLLRHRIYFYPNQLGFSAPQTGTALP